MPVIIVGQLDFGGQGVATQNQGNPSNHDHSQNGQAGNGNSGSNMSDKQFQAPQVDDSFADDIPFS